GNDVPLGAPMNRAHRHDSGILRRDLAADNSLDGHDVFGGKDNRVLARLRARPMRAHTTHSDVDRADGSERGTCDYANFPSFEAAIIVYRNGVIWLPEASINIVVEHGLGTGHRLLGRLTHEHQCAVPAVF